jgi:hypothetical protein
MSDNQAKYISFVQADKSLEGDFLDQLKESQPVLDGILTKYDKLLKLKIHSCALDGVFLVLVVSHTDELSNKLGKEFNFPRGFPIVWNQLTGSIKTYGFYPKFENDEDEDDDDEMAAKLFRSCKSIRLNYKYSGYLGQVFAFQHNGIYYWSACAKNSACANKPEEFNFSADIARIVAPKMTFELVKHMADTNTFFCGEVMSKADSNHGAKVHSEALVITMVGTSCDGTFRTIWPQDQVFDFAIRFNLDVDDVFTVNKNIYDFGRELRIERSQITLTGFVDFINRMTEHCNIIVRRGTIRHCDILGERLEGVIMKLEMPEGTGIVKYKFPFYTIVTMLIRNIIMGNADSRNPEKWESIKQRQARWFSPSYYAHLSLWIKRWVKVDKDYWFFVGTLIIAKIKELMEQYDPASGVGFQIFVLDSIARLPEFQFNDIIDYKSVSNAFRLWNDEESKELVNASEHKSIVIATGSANNAFVKALGPKFVSISAKNTEGTVKAIIDVFKSGKIPVVISELETFIGGRKKEMLFGQSILQKFPDTVINCVVVAPKGNVENEEAFILLQPKGVHQKKLDANFRDANKKLLNVPAFIENLEQCEMLGRVFTYDDKALDSLLMKL